MATTRHTPTSVDKKKGKTPADPAFGLPAFHLPTPPVVAVNKNNGHSRRLLQGVELLLGLFVQLLPEPGARAYQPRSRRRRQADSWTFWTHAPGSQKIIAAKGVRIRCTEVGTPDGGVLRLEETVGTEEERRGLAATNKGKRGMEQNATHATQITKGWCWLGYIYRRPFMSSHVKRPCLPGGYRSSSVDAASKNKKDEPYSFSDCDAPADAGVRIVQGRGAIECTRCLPAIKVDQGSGAPNSHEPSKHKRSIDRSIGRMTLLH